MAVKSLYLGFAVILCAAAILSSSDTASGESDKVIAYYFHGSFRCPTCQKLERYSKEAIEESFGPEMAKGSLEFRSVNVDEKVNEHFVADYNLYAKSLIISKVKNGKDAEYKNLTKIWEYVGNKEKFFDYVTGEIRPYLEE